ncbi:plasmid mobilization relaxosome protein MobC [Sulfurirhabdus autotrophica]|uniref:Mobilization protein MobC n=1 Tax=Sulfurirhabdus autotrophica TaxID=1706046 RepID=A0A4R3XU14_9PROT|nr:plasmid mobilization relaxosome protein MobC [Sulfurirhabdus autotrophica]TCV82716.1 mobilization protein MobC [Sulfurirhabdus autotrophica]
MKTAFLKTPVEPELLAGFMAFSASNDLSPSVALRRVIFHVLTQAGYTINDYDPTKERSNDYAQWARRRREKIDSYGAQPILIARVTPGMKDVFDTYAKANAETTPVRLKNLVQKVVQSANLNTAEMVPVKIPEPRTERVTTGFSKSEMKEMRLHAENFGSVREWLVALARSRILPEVPQFSTKEIQVLYASNRELWAIGRNLNQIAHAINLDIKQTGRLESSVSRLKELDELKAAIDIHTSHVMKVCNASLDRWKS